MDTPQTKKKYEGMFLIDNTHASKDWDEVVKHVHELLQRHGAEVVSTEKWGERKLAYKVKGQKRGTYLLTRFNAPPEAITPIKQRCIHSEIILRILIVNDLGLGTPPPAETEGKAADTQTQAKPPEPIEEEGKVEELAEVGQEEENQ